MENVISAMAERIAAKLAESMAGVIERELREEMANVFGVTSPRLPAASKSTPGDRLPPASTVLAGAVSKGRAKPVTVDIDAVRGVLQGSPKGLRAEQLRQVMGLPASAGRKLTRILKQGVDAKVLVCHGNNRARVYRLR